MIVYFLVIPVLVLVLGLALAVFLMLRDANSWEERPRDGGGPRTVDTGRWVLSFVLIIAAAAILGCGVCFTTFNLSY